MNSNIETLLNDKVVKSTLEDIIYYYCYDYYYSNDEIISFSHLVEYLKNDKLHVPSLIRLEDKNIFSFSTILTYFIVHLYECVDFIETTMEEWKKDNNLTNE